MIGIEIKSTIGVGDALQYSSLPENYFAATGQKLIDVSHPWFFDKNPYVVRTTEKPERVQQMWNFSPTVYEWPNPREKDKPAVYNSNAEIWAAVFGVPVVMNRPRLYLFEEYPFHQREKIMLQLHGVSHGTMPENIVNHVVEKYGVSNLSIVGPVPEKYEYLLKKFPHEYTPTLWHLAEKISQARMLIALDSGPAWIAACYPDVIVKKVRTKPLPENFEKWVPLEQRNIHSHWDDRCHMIHNTSDRDIGFTWGYKRI